MSHRWGGAATVSAAATIVLLLAAGPLANATGTGYELHFSRHSGSTSDTAIDLTSVTSTDPGGSNISVTFTVSGEPNVASDLYTYSVFLGGPTWYNASASVLLTNNTTYAYLAPTSSGTGTGLPIPYHLNGSTISVSVPKAAVGSPTGFAVNVEATFYDDRHSFYLHDWLGSDTAASAGNGVNCLPGAVCTGGFSLANLGGLLLVEILVGAIVPIAGIVIIVLAIQHEQKPRPPPYLPPPPGVRSPPRPPLPSAWPPPPPPPPPW
jgi:hypothetical protein